MATGTNIRRKMQRHSFLAAIALVCCTNASGEAGLATLPEEPPVLAMRTDRDRIGRIVAPVVINGSGPFNLVVDTGANSTTFTADLAQRLKIDYGNTPPVRVNGVTGTALAPVAAVDRLQAGTLVLEDQLVPIVDAHVMADADGILGIAALTDKQLFVDFRRNQVLLTASRKLPSTILRVKAKRLACGLLATRAQVGSVRVTAIIDTGAERTLGNRALQEALAGAHSPLRSVNVFGTTAHVALGNLVVVDKIRIGDVRVNNGEVAFGDFHVFDLWDLEDQPALIVGMDIIGRLDLFIIDFRRLEIGFRG